MHHLETERFLLLRNESTEYARRIMSIPATYVLATPSKLPMSKLVLLYVYFATKSKATVVFLTKGDSSTPY
jgi:hypothetical protein